MLMNCVALIFSTRALILKHYEESTNVQSCFCMCGLNLDSGAKAQVSFADNSLDIQAAVCIEYFLPVAFLHYMYGETVPLIRQNYRQSFKRD